MARKLRVEMNSRGAIAILQDPGVLDDLTRRGNNIAASMPAGEWEVNSFTGYDRGQVYVRSTDQAARLEAAENPAGVIAALDAGRQ